MPTSSTHTGKVPDTAHVYDAIVVGGGQSGLAAARALVAQGLTPVVLEAGPEPVGSWPHYYGSLTAFSPVAFSAMPGLRFDGDPDHYPHRDEVVAYLRRYAASVDVEIRPETTVTAIEHHGVFVVHTAVGDNLAASSVIAASGSFANPRVPVLAGQDAFNGHQLHVADYDKPDRYTGQRVLVVGGGNSAIQVAYELAQVAQVTLATRRPITFFPQILDGRDVHYWLTTSGFDRLPPSWLARIITTRFVMDTGDYQNALEAGTLNRRPIFTRLEGDAVVWPDGQREPVDAVIYATGYRPELSYLEPLGTLDADGPKHSGGISTTHPGLAYVGLEFQRSFASNTLRGVHRDAEHIAAPLAALVRDAAAAVGLGVGRRPASHGRSRTRRGRQPLVDDAQLPHCATCGTDAGGS